MAEVTPKAKIGMQILGAIAACMGGFSLGTVIGWSAPASAILENEGLDKERQIGHISSIMCLGAAAAQFYLALTLDRIGRKWTMIIIAIPFIGAWILLGLVSKFYAYLIGRFLVGFCGGAFCVAAPTYIGEYSEKGIRGFLGVMFQLLLVIGIEFAFILGLPHNMYVLCFPMLSAPVICIIMMLFLPESPVFLMAKGRQEKARSALTFYRGKNYDIEPEVIELTEYTNRRKESFKENMKERATIKAFVMLLLMHILQQLSGINAVMFNATDIFKTAATNLDEDVCTIIMGAVQIATCLAVAFLIEKIGRKLLWLISLAIMAVCLILLGVYFIIKAKEDKENKSEKDKFYLKIAIIPLLLVCLYIMGFCLAAGPLPWSMLGELLPSGIKAICGSVITFVNWLLAYAVTTTYPYLYEACGHGPVFIGYGVICVLGFLYILFFVIETRNKTLEEIQVLLGGKWRVKKEERPETSTSQ